MTSNDDRQAWARRQDRLLDANNNMLSAALKFVSIGGWLQVQTIELWVIWWPAHKITWQPFDGSARLDNMDVIRILTWQELFHWAEALKLGA